MKELKDLLDDFIEKLETRIILKEIKDEIGRGQNVPTHTRTTLTRKL